MNLPVESIAKLSLKPGDVLVVRVSSPMSQLQRQEIRHVLKTEVGIKNKIVIMPAQFSFEVIDPTDEDMRTGG